MSSSTKDRTQCHLVPSAIGLGCHPLPAGEDFKKTTHEGSISVKVIGLYLPLGAGSVLASQESPWALTNIPSSSGSLPSLFTVEIRGATWAKCVGSQHTVCFPQNSGHVYPTQSPAQGSPPAQGAALQVCLKSKLQG